jgi:hypothetical protein
MAIFASTFRSWFFMIILTHWLIMYFWILRLKTNYCITSEDVYNAREEIFEKFYDFVCSFIYVFCYFNLKAGRTRLRYLIYYIVFYAENILFCTSYFIFSKDASFSFKLAMLLIVIIGFWVAIFFQIVYYLRCHPSSKISVCVRHDSKFYFIHNEMLKPATAHFTPLNTSYDDGCDDSNVDDEQQRNYCKYHRQKMDEELKSKSQNPKHLLQNTFLIQLNNNKVEPMLNENNNQQEKDKNSSYCSSIVAAFDENKSIKSSSSTLHEPKPVSSGTLMQGSTKNKKNLDEPIEIRKNSQSLFLEPVQIERYDSINSFSSIKSYCLFRPFPQRKTIMRVPQTRRRRRKKKQV